MGFLRQLEIHQKFAKTSQMSPLVTNKHRENQAILNSKFSPGMKTYAGAIPTKGSKKSYIIGNSHLNKIREDKFKESLTNAPVYVKSFSDAKTNQLHYYVVPMLVDDKPNNVVIQIGSNEITKSN